jgi:predicted site-specific integrase-resolvase
MPTDTGSSRSEWLKTRELAAREGVHVDTIWRWVKKGLVEAKRLDARTGVRVRVAERER